VNLTPAILVFDWNIPNENEKICRRENCDGKAWRISTQLPKYTNYLSRK
jgi:hypothetical protein